MYDNETTPFNDNFSGLRVSSQMKHNWNTTSKWARFFAILGFVMVGLSLLLVGSVGAAMESIASLSGNMMLSMMMGPMMTYLTVFLVIVSLVQLAYHYYHLRFANDMKKALQFTDQGAFEESWKNLRNHFRIFGIMVIAVLAFYIIAFIAMASMVGSMMPPAETFPTE